MNDFVDARSELRDGDEAVCPRCGAHHVFRLTSAGDADVFGATNGGQPVNGRPRN
jgi:hypothetical protein